MPENKIVNNPDFTTDETVEGDTKEEKETTTEEVVEETKTPTETSTETQEGEEEQPKETKEGEALEKQTEKLEQENAELDIELERRREAITEQRRQRREKRESLKDLEEVPEKDDLSDIDKVDITRLERVLKAKGFVPASEMQRQTFKDAQKSTESEFFKTHPEYLPANDEGDVLYNALRGELEMFAQPKSVSEINTIFDRAHSAVRAQFPNRFLKKSSSGAGAAQRQKLKTAGTGTGSQGSPAATTKTSLSDTQKQQLKDGGFSDEDIAEM